MRGGVRVTQIVTQSTTRPRIEAYARRNLSLVTLYGSFINCLVIKCVEAPLLFRMLVYCIFSTSCVYCNNFEFRGIWYITYELNLNLMTLSVRKAYHLP